MKCKVCGGDKIKVAYKGLIRDGGLGKYTKEEVTMWQCKSCDVIWHDVLSDTKKYYESKEYRNKLEGSSDAEIFYKFHDKETFNKLQYTGTDCFRHKTMADIGCGAGAFLDFLSGVCEVAIGIEPSETYRQIMNEKGYQTYAYADEAIVDWQGKVDVVTSFDVIEHVEEPVQFLKDINMLLSKTGGAIIGTPTDAPVMRQMLGNIYEQKLLFSTQHLWVFSEKNLKMMAKEAGFEQIEVLYYQRYGLSNFIGWIKEQRAYGELDYSFISDTMDAVWKSELSRQGLSDYIVLYLKK